MTTCPYDVERHAAVLVAFYGSAEEATKRCYLAHNRLPKAERKQSVELMRAIERHARPEARRR